MCVCASRCLLLSAVGSITLPHGYASGSVDLLVINSLSQDAQRDCNIATRTACPGYSAVADERQHCDGTGGPFNQLKAER